MEAPKCRICGQKHWSDRSCSAMLRREVIPVSDRNTVALTKRIRELEAEVASLETALAANEVNKAVSMPVNKPDRKAYMRAYMAKRRAKKKPE